MPKEETKEIVITPTNPQTNIVLPAVSGKEALEAWKQYLDLKKAIIDRETDIQVIESKDFLKKSYWRKAATFFNLTVEKIDESHETLGKTFVWHFTCKAIAPNGRTAIGTGSCDAFEKATLVDGEYKAWDKFKKVWKDAKPNTIHNIRSTAETRAFNRAVSNLVGGGEVSAEEVDQVHEESEHIAPANPFANSTEVDTSTLGGPSMKTFKHYYALLKELNINPEEADTKLYKKYRVKSKTELTEEQMQEAIKALELKKSKAKEDISPDEIPEDLGLSEGK